MKEQNENDMKLKLLTAITFTFISASSYADTINAQLDLGPTGLYGRRFNGYTGFDVPAPDVLTGIALNGQNITINYQFSNGGFIRVYGPSKIERSLLIELDFSGTGDAGIGHDIAGTLTLAGSTVPLSLGTFSNDQKFGLSLFTSVPVSMVGTFPLDVYGFSVNFNLPQHPDARFDSRFSDFVFNASPFGTAFGVGPGIPADIPDSGTTLGLVTSAVLLLVAIERCANSL